jgi:hypothetical protein
VPARTPVYRAPMRPRDRDLPAGIGADHGVEHGLVGTGDALDPRPATLDDAVDSAAAIRGGKAARMLRRFAELPEDAFVWTRDSDGMYFLGRIAGPWRYDDSPPAREVGIHHVRPAHWLDRPFGDDEVPAAVAATFARGGRNLQRIGDEHAERRTAELWEREGGP